MILVRRFVVLAAWSFWLGGFVFYTAVVVPISMRVLERHPHMPKRTQGFVTREVATSLNVTGAAALAVFAVETLGTRRAAGRLAWAQALCVALMTAGLVWLVLLHPRMDEFLDSATEEVSDRSAFYALHRQYLWVSTLQFGVGVVYLLLLPAAWRREDRAPPS